MVYAHNLHGISAVRSATCTVKVAAAFNHTFHIPHKTVKTSTGTRMERNGKIFKNLKIFHLDFTVILRADKRGVIRLVIYVLNKLVYSHSGRIMTVIFNVLNEILALVVNVVRWVLGNFENI